MGSSPSQDDWGKMSVNGQTISPGPGVLAHRVSTYTLSWRKVLWSYSLDLEADTVQEGRQSPLKDVA